MQLVSRAEWGARPPKTQIPAIDSQVTTGHWEGPALWHGVIGPHTSCAPMVRGIQAYHMDHNGWTDIAYNGVACPHGYVFEGRGPQRYPAANGTTVANRASAVICYLGGQGDPFTAEGQQAMLDGAAWLGDPMLKGHRDWYNTACPGDVIYAWIGAGHAPAPTPTPPPQPAPGPVGHVAMPLTQQGNTGRNVRIVQAITGSAVDGIFGPNTKQSVVAMQTVLGGSPDGIVGDDTWTRFLQYRLNLVYGGGHPAIDGAYGPDTTSYVLWYQASHGLEVDGIAGINTFGSLTGQ